ncbi:MAG TPA: hypothetical protein VIM69_01435 [Opitutaceae bacterium]
MASHASEIITEITRTITPNRIAESLMQLLSAEFIDKRGERHADHRVRASAVQLLLAYTVGKPVERSESVVVNVSPESEVVLLEKLKQSPALRAALREILE